MIMRKVMTKLMRYQEVYKIINLDYQSNDDKSNDTFKNWITAGRGKSSKYQNVIRLMSIRRTAIKKTGCGCRESDIFKLGEPILRPKHIQIDNVAVAVGIASMCLQNKVLMFKQSPLAL